MRLELLVFFWIFTGLLIAAGLLHLLPRLGSGLSQRAAVSRCLMSSYSTSLFFLFSRSTDRRVVRSSERGLAQLATLLTWQTIHEAFHREATKGPRIIKILNRKFGALRNLTAVYVTVSPYRSFGLSAWPN